MQIQEAKGRGIGRTFRERARVPLLPQEVPLVGYGLHAIKAPDRLALCPGPAAGLGVSGHGPFALLDSATHVSASSE